MKGWGQYDVKTEGEYLMWPTNVNGEECEEVTDTGHFSDPTIGASAFKYGGSGQEESAPAAQHRQGESKGGEEEVPGG